ncbi:hypothetical protein [Arthrobacter sp. HLT1-20]
MGFMTFLAVIGLVMAAALIGFVLGGFHETETGKKPDTTEAGVTFTLLFDAVCCAFILVDPAIIGPLWLRCVSLAAVPVAARYGARRLLARKLSRSGA